MAQKRSSSTRRRKRSSTRRYSPAARKQARAEMRHLKKGKHPKRVKSRKQAAAVGLAKARRKAKKVPRKASRK